MSPNHSAEPPPSYSASVGISADEPDLPPDKQRLNEDLIRDDNDLASNSHPPPPFSVTPGTLVLSPYSKLIHSPVSGARPLYQLSDPLNRHALNTSLMSIPITRLLNEDGTMKTVRSKDELYHIYEAHPAFTRLDKGVIISGQHAEQFGGVRLRRDISVGITGLKTVYDVLSVDESKHPRRLYHAKQKKGVLEWHDGGGELIAVESRAEGSMMDEEALEIKIPLDKRHLDLMVALWVARIWQEKRGI
ncbi:hypothetical protein BD289DRAFT_485042 [Coniella lustricola]|uniref:Uncharacterized protein n=1 Tax=Coniella lustricola TaxID=2025994 RepID=A0A2T2ZZZ5_9PEZI|nr:hypothetical protein BD289DRAFT_485042 [Coniella lustricola]